MSSICFVVDGPEIPIHGYNGNPDQIKHLSCFTCDVLGHHFLDCAEGDGRGCRRNICENPSLQGPEPATPSDLPGPRSASYPSSGQAFSSNRTSHRYPQYYSFFRRDRMRLAAPILTHRRAHEAAILINERLPAQRPEKDSMMSDKKNTSHSFTNLRGLARWTHPSCVHAGDGPTPAHAADVMRMQSILLRTPISKENWTAMNSAGPKARYANRSTEVSEWENSKRRDEKKLKKHTVRS